MKNLYICLSSEGNSENRFVNDTIIRVVIVFGFGFAPIWQLISFQLKEELKDKLNMYFLGEELNKEELIGLIQTGEGYTLEFKERIPSDLGRHICAFANASGGRVILGVRDDSTFSDYRMANNDEAAINNTARNLEPSVRVFVERVDDFAVIRIPEGENKPYSSAGQFFLRIGSTYQQLKRDEIREFFLKERLVRFDEKPNMDFDFSNDFNSKKFHDFLAKANITPLTNEKDTLHNLNLLDGEHMRNAGILFFSNTITKFFISATVVCVLYQGTTKQTILDRKEFNADTVSNYGDALTYLRSKLNTYFIIKKERTEKLELPEEALREALINAIVHRDYFSNGHVQIDIYLDRVDISNPGGLVPGLARKDFGKRSMPRNPLLMDLFLRIDKVEKVGSGIKRIHDTMKEYGLSAKFDISEDWFSVVFPRTSLLGSAKERLFQNYPKTIPETILKILNAIQENPRITIPDLAEKSGLSEVGVKYNLKKLKKQGLVKRIGPKKGGHWEIKNENGLLSRSNGFA